MFSRVLDGMAHAVPESDGLPDYVFGNLGNPFASPPGLERNAAVKKIPLASQVHARGSWVHSDPGASTR